MITEKIKSLFNFIEFLHSNIKNFKKYDVLIEELYLLREERIKVSHKKNFADKLKYDEVQAEIKDKIKVIQENIILPIKAKAIDLKVCNFVEESSFSWYGVENEIHNLKENFNNDDLPEIFSHKNKYIEYRTKTNCTYFQDFFFNDLDEILKELFDFFKDSSENEFETFETKTIQAISLHEAVEHLQKGQNKISLPIDFLNSSKDTQRNNEALPPQPKEYKSLTRARAFCIIEILKLPEFKETRFSKKEIVLLVEKEFEGQSGKTVYEESGKLTNNMDDAKIKYKLDYDYGMKLYREIYPNT